MGFRDDIEMLKKYLPEPPHRQTFLCSATISAGIKQVTQAYLRPDHIFIKTISDDTSPVHAHVSQHHTVLPKAADQVPHLVRLIAHDQMVNAGKSKIVVFLNTTKQTQLFATLLRELVKTSAPAARTNVYELHSKRTQEARSRTSNMFRNDTSGAAVLVTSDVSARGVDYPKVTRVIQVGVPGTQQTYVHRVGRTGRAGTEGRGDLILLPWEHGFVTWQLTEVPMKPLTTTELQDQVTSLATEFEANPAKFLGNTRVEKPRGRMTSYTEPATFPPGVPARVQNVATAVTDLQGRLDEEAINETFLSLVGFYVPKAPDLRTQKDVIVEGCKTWAVEVGGLPTPPYVSPMLLQKMGYSGNSTKNFSRSQRSWQSQTFDFKKGPQHDEFTKGPRMPWMQRGSSKRW